ncbi:MAG: BlaI/MecI/CopY family transcriptional regulator [Bacteroidales bacterium]|nr:BlaI/MecI/CopY family transcriptional regulator [Bacteroidales bacterium]
MKHRLTDKEEELMNIMWERGPLFVREIVELYPEPRPHFNTISTYVRALEAKGLLCHEAFGNTYRYEAAISREDYGTSWLRSVVDRYFGSSLRATVSALCATENISDDELRQLLDMVNKSKREKTDE